MCVGVCFDVGVTDDDPLTPEERHFAAAVRSTREARGWSQAELLSRLRRLGIESLNQTALSRIENGTRPVRMIEAQALSRIFDKPVASMLNSDSREAQLSKIADSHAEARKAYVALKAAAEGFARATRRMEKDLEILQGVFGRMDDLEPAVLQSYAQLVKNIEQFVAIDFQTELQKAWERGRKG